MQSGSGHRAAGSAATRLAWQTMTNDAWVVALDSGGTSLKSGAVPPADPVQVRVTVTPVDSRGAAAAIVRDLAVAIEARLADIPEGEPVAGIAVALPGPFDYEAGVRPPGAHPTDTKYLGLTGVPLAAALTTAVGTDLPVRFVNDAEAAALGEARYGAGAGSRRVLTVTLGTGLGAALVVDGAVLRQVGGTVVGELYAAALPSGSSADDAFSHRGLQSRIDALDDPAAAAAGFAADLGAFLAPVVATGGVDLVVVAGGVAAEVSPHLPLTAAACGIPAVPGTLADAAGVLGAATMFGMRGF